MSLSICNLARGSQAQVGPALIGVMDSDAPAGRPAYARLVITHHESQQQVRLEVGERTSIPGLGLITLESVELPPEREDGALVTGGGRIVIRLEGEG